MQPDPAMTVSEDTVMPLYNGKTGELMKDLPAPFSVRLRRKRWLEMLREGIDVKASLIWS